MLKVTLVFCAVLAVCYAGLAIVGLDNKPEKFSNVKGCYLKEFDEVIQIDQSKPSKVNCLMYRCYNKSMGYESCGSANTGGPCRVVRDNSKPYPDCCPIIQCPPFDE